MRGLSRALALVVSCMLIAGCGTTLRKRNLDDLGDLARYPGIVRHEGRPDALLIVLLLNDDGTEILSYAIPEPTGRFEIVRREGNYRLLAWIDLNENFRWDVGEPWRLTEEYAVPDPEGAPDANVITIEPSPAKNPPLRLSVALDDLPSGAELRKAALGRVVSFDDPVLGAETGLESLWQPIEFLRAGKAGLYTLEPPAPGKTPVVMICGIGGSPAEFHTLVSHLDKTRFQPVFVLYPSGLTIETSAWILQRLATEVHARWPDDPRAILVAHSMGGLVARETINRMVRAGTRYPMAFISISTPWGGHEASSERGSRWLGVPVWADLVPGSTFLSRLFETALPEDLHYYLLFSYAGASALVKGPDDGTVSIPSMLAYPAQDRSLMTYGFAESHTSILESDKALSVIIEILERERAGAEASAGN